MLQRIITLVATSALLASLQARAAAPSAKALERAKASYASLEFEACLNELAAAEREEDGGDEQVEIALYFGLCHFNQGRKAEAREAFERALALDPKAQLPPMTSPRIMSLFKSIPVPKRAAPVEPPELDAPTPLPVPIEPAIPAPLLDAVSLPERSPAQPESSPHVASLLIGSAALVAGGVGGYFGLEAQRGHAQAVSARFAADAVRYDAGARLDARRANTGFIVAGTLVVGAVVAFLIE